MTVTTDGGSEVDTVGARAGELLGAAGELRRAAGVVPGDVVVEPPDLASAVIGDALARVAFLGSNLPQHCCDGLTTIADGLVQGAVDVMYADDPLGGV